MCGSGERDVVFRGNVDVSTLSRHDSFHYACTASSIGKYADIVRCRRCDVVYLASRPSDEALDRLYRSVVDNTYLEEEEGRYKTFAEALRDTNRHAPGKGTMLEIGSYTGVFLELARKDGWSGAGVEPSDWARDVAKRKRGIDLLPSVSDLAGHERESFDCVIMWDVIEHLGDPRGMLETARDLLKPGGLLGLSTITIDSLSARLLRGRYPFLMQMHLVYFTRKTLIRLLEESGFEVLEYKRHRRYVTYAYLISKFPALSFLKRAPLLWDFLERTYFISSVGLRDVYARKSEKACDAASA